MDAEGIRATPEKISAIVNAPQPENVQQLRSFLGLLNYYRKFLPHLATILGCTQAINTARDLLKTSNLLTHYDSTLPIQLATDASQYGLGAIISHVLPNGMEKPIAFASRTLSVSERNYSQIDKEALAISSMAFRSFTSICMEGTDHKPLTSILGPKKSLCCGCR